MKEQLKALYELQKLDIEIARANAGLAALDGALALRQKHAAAKKQSDEAHKALIDAEIELKDSELQLKSIDEKRAATEKKLYGGGIMSAKESTSLEKEIEHLKGQQGQLDGRVLDLYDLVESLREKDKAARGLVEDLERQAREAIGREATERKRLEIELDRLDPERADAVTKVTDQQLLSRYEAIRKRTASTGIARIVDHKCEGCHVAVTSFTARNLFQDKGVEYCENCGRILMLDVE
jgi:predicted  nucleic acid-binding Zn-ribbon protein